MRSVVLGTVLLTLASGVSAQSSRHTLPGADVAIYNLVGTINLVAGTGAEVVVEVNRTGPDAGKLRVESGRIGNRQTLRVIFPSDVITYRGLGRWSGTDQMAVRDDGTFGGGSQSGDRRGDRRGERRGGRRVRISGREGGLNAAAEVTVQVPAGKAVAVNIGAGEATVKNIDGDILVYAASASVTIEGTRGRLRLDSGSGELTVTNAAGDISLDAGSGEVTLSRIRADRLAVDAGSGALRGNDIEVADFSADLGSGGARLSRVKTSDLKLDSGSGGVDIELIAGVRSAVIEAGSGSVTLRVPESLGATLEIETGSGGIDTDFPLTVNSRSRSYMRGTIGDGRGRISIETGSGGVRLRRS